MTPDMIEQATYISRNARTSPPPASGGQRPPPKILPIYISWYINDYG
jgi:hypothetical protein